ncbi:hypothetical protein SISNIDRAFT_433285 [Sistotremastrum niveocremeum HHB9708]|uniref:Zn(2)-C6 fungal-type domain-containing protein n=1 Tax=Sistotremastrum niveocremeum HHB9708 TaxID=1314777 RepID=A0A164NRG7_9AGAM|nr:hypothetical protein SISNIDRAFT_433285 [Sistotremastrum niveocremeum HHB9708]
MSEFQPISYTPRTGDNTSGRREKHATKACNVCRKRKGKCDGENGLRTCSYCRKHRHDCSFDPNDGRGPVWNKQTMEAYKVAVDSLTAQNIALQEEVARLKEWKDAMTLESSNTHSSTSETSSVDIDITELCDMVDRRLVMQDNNQLMVYGGWSPFVSLGHSSPSAPLSEKGQDHPAPLATPSVQLVPTNHCSMLHSADGSAWRRFLPADAVLTLPGQDPYDPSEHDGLLHLFFQFFASWNFRVSPTLFWRDMYEALKPNASPSSLRTAHYSPFLHNAMLSIAAAYSDSLAIKAHPNRILFANAAKAMFEDECQSPTISTVSGFSFLASFHSGRNEHALGFVYIGLSVRMARALGLNINCSHWVKSGDIHDSDMRDRYWGFWTTYSQDVWWSLYVGREFSINFSHVVIPLPSDDNLPEDDHPWYLPGVDDSDIPSMRRDVFIQTCRLTVIATKIMDLIYGLNQRTGSAHQFLATLRIEIQQWAINVPKELAATDTALPNVLMMHIAASWLIILMERPFYSIDLESISRKRCQSAVHDILENVRRWKERYTLRFTPITLTCALFGAATTNLLSISRAPQRAHVLRAKLHGGIKECIGYLNDIGETWACGAQIAQILVGLLQAGEKGKEVGPEEDDSLETPASELVDMYVYQSQISPAEAE